MCALVCVLGHNASYPSSVVAQGAEFPVLAHLLATGTLCRLQLAAVEFHDERWRRGHMVPILRASGGPHHFFSVLRYMLRHSPSCTVELAEVSPVDSLR